MSEESLKSQSTQQQLTAVGMSESQATAKAILFATAAKLLKSRGVDASGSQHAFYVPGRIELLGKHTDYAGGRSLLCALDRGFCLIAVPRRDSLVRILGKTADSDLVFPLESGLIPNAGQWSNYPMTVGRRIAQNFPGKLTGADIAFISDLPASSGLSSSSAMIISFFLGLSSVNHLSDRSEYKANIKSPVDLPAYLGTIENGQNFGTLKGDQGVGTFGGSEDHTAIMLGEAGQLSQYSFCPTRFERKIPLPADHVVVIGVSGVLAEKTGAAQRAYNQASLTARAVLAHWNNCTGRADATLAAAVLAAGAVRVRLTLKDKPLIDRFDQFVAESTQIIPAAGDALLSGRFAELGNLVDWSQDLSEKLLKNQVPETVLLAKSARECGAVAASAFGAGFGGSVWALIPLMKSESFISSWRAGYESRFPESARRSNFFQAAAGVPAMAIKLD